MRHFKIGMLIVLVCVFGCKNETKATKETSKLKIELKKKEVVYQVFTRLFG